MDNIQRPKRYHGVVSESAGRGDKILTPYGKDSSDVTYADDRMPKFAGSDDNLSHTLEGNRAQLKGS